MTQRIKRAFQKLIDSRASEWIDEQYVYLGSDDGVTVQVPDKPGAYFARQLNGDVIEVYNSANIPPHFNLQVKIGRSRSLPTIWQIIHIRQTFDVPVGFGEVGYHAHQHMHDGGDRLPVDRRQILQLSVFVSNSAGFIVRVNGSIVPTATGLAMVSTQDVDLSSHVITAGAKYVSIEVNDAGTLSTNAGTVFASPDIATAANIPAPAAGKYHIAHVLFYEGQTGLLDTHIGIPWPLNSFPVTAGAQINTATADTPLDADKFGFWDVVDSLLKSVTWLNIKATLKTYFDTLYSVLGHSHAAPDASVVTYTPTTVADWTGSADPGDVDNALDQLAERVTDFAAAGFNDAEGDPSAVAGAPADGTSTFAARRDHVHDGSKVLIYDQTLGGTAASINLYPTTTLPTTFKHLEIDLVLRTNKAAVGSEAIKIEINDDAGNNYSCYVMFHWSNSQWDDQVQAAGGPVEFCYANAAGSPANEFAAYTLHIYDYRATDKNKNFQSRGGQRSGTAGTDMFIYDAYGSWISTAAITKIEIYPAGANSFIAGCRATLWGVR